MGRTAQGGRGGQGVGLRAGTESDDEVRAASSARALVVAAVVAAVALLAGCLYQPGNPGTASIKFTIDVSLDQHADLAAHLRPQHQRPATVASTRTTALRMGGNRWTAYNWENNASNAGSDWCFQNDGLLSSSDTPGEAVKPTITQAKNAGAPPS